MPTEKQLCQQFGVSAITVRQAMAELVRDGLIYRQRGRGSFVESQPAAAERHVFHLQEYSLQESSGLTTAILGSGVVPASPEVAADLDLPGGAKCLQVERAKYLADRPVVLERIHLPLPVAAALRPDGQWHSASLRDLMRRHLQVAGGRVAEDFHVAGAAATDGAMLDVAPGTPLVFRRTLLLRPTGEPVAVRRAVYRPDAYQFKVEYTL